ncbi:MAG: helix-turn-helix transcriptional regulator [Acidobacteria bacterium]|nr:helix-turn-helix transcriptional regulator [Acidobacteriota bacterium]
MASQIKVTAIHGFGSAELRPGGQVGPRLLNDWELVLVTVGRARWEASGECVELGPGDLLLAPPGRRELLVVDGQEPLRHRFVHLLGTGPLSALPRRTTGAGSGIALPLLCHVQHLATVQPAGWFEQASGALALLLQAISMGCLDAPNESLPPLHPAVKKALAHLDHRWQRGLVAVSVAEMAHVAGISREHLTRLFQSTFGLGPGQAERFLRLDRSIDWLTSTDLDVPTIAQRAGWKNPQRYTAALRAGCGKGPRELRRAWREGKGVRAVALSRLLARFRAASSQA